MKKALVFITSCFLFAFISCIGSSNSDSTIDNGIRCSIMAEDFVKSKLKYPNEVKFNTNQYVHEVEGSEAIVLNKFTAKNSFGVESNFVYKIWLSFNGGDWTEINNWSYSKLIIENSDTGEKQIYR
ncbi:MAG TPA: hypothetical protein PKH58_11425 [Paludibacteraceae bacterium]|nr:hypothetical protein [Paludibacteraceae bacterium]